MRVLKPNALGKLRVLDLTQFVSGPYCTKLLADLGAEVIKVERPKGGDKGRYLAPFKGNQKGQEKSLLFQYLNTNKKSITLDLKSDLGKKAFHEILGHCDLLVENFKPGTLERIGIDKNTLLEKNKNLVITSISNFGQTGPYKNYGANDLIHYALSGLMFVFGSVGKEPLKHAFRQSQFKAGTNAASASLLGVYGTRFGLAGQTIDISIHESMASAVRDTTSSFASTGVVPTRQGQMNGEIPRAPIKAKDGYVVPINFGGSEWAKTANLLENKELLQERFSSQESRRTHSDEFETLVRKAFENKNKFDLFYEAHSHRELVYGVVQDASELLRNPQYEYDEYFEEINHPVTGGVLFPGSPIKFSETPRQKAYPAPLLGQHNEEIIQRLTSLTTVEIDFIKESVQDE